MAGAGKGNGKGPAVATGAILGAFLLLGLVLFGVAAAIILSLISIYTSNNSKQANGDYFTIKSFGMKFLYPLTSGAFDKGSIAESTSLSSLCTTMYAKTSSAKSFAGCVATNFVASSSNNSTTSRRRRQANNAAVGLGQLNLYYTTTCGSTSDINKGSNATSINDCVKSRLAECNAMVSSSNFTQWTPISSGFTLSILNNGSSYTSIAPSQIFALSKVASIFYANTSFSNTTAQSLVGLGCVYGGPISIDAIAAALAAQSTATTTLATSTNAAG